MGASKVTDSDMLRIAEYCKANLDLPNAKLGEEYYYQSLPLCVIDAVFSIGVRYSSTENTVRRFCDHFEPRTYSAERPPTTEQMSVSEFVKIHNRYSCEEMAEKVYQNRQRTSARSGILKSRAILLFAKVLRQFRVDYYQDVDSILGNPAFEARIAEIPGQRSGISTRYFYMLAGSPDYIMPDRMIARFIWSAIQKTLSIEESHEAIVGAHRILAAEYPQLAPRSLDHLIWLHQRGIAQTPIGKCYRRHSNE